MHPVAVRGLQVLLQQAQRMRHRRPGGQLRRREDLAAAIGNDQRLAQMRAESGEIFHRQCAAIGANVGGDTAGEIAVVEIARSLRGELCQRRLQLVLRHPDDALDTPWRVRRQTILEIGGGACGIAPQVGGATRDHRVVHQSTSRPSPASSTLGPSNSRHGILAWRRCASSMPATTPGTAIEPGP